MHPKSVPSTLLLGVVQPEEITMVTTDSPVKKIVGTNGIPRGCMSFPPGPPLHLLRQAWNQIDCSWVSLSQEVFRLSKWILKQRCNADFEVYAKRIWHPVHLVKYQEVFMPNNGHKTKSKRCKQYLQFNRPKGVITRHFHNMAQK
jgi:hypothetical protein